MGLSTINVEFKAAAQTAVKRSANGTVALILKDETKEDTTYVYNNETEVVKSCLLYTSTFAAYCDSYAQWVLAEKAIQAKQPDKNSPAPLTFITAKGYEQQIPEISISNTAKKQMLTFAKEFGLTPSSRAGMTNPVETEDKKASIMEFISKKNRSA